MPINAKQKRAIPILLTSTTYQEAANKLGVTERTLYRWLQDPEFLTALDKAESEILATVSRGMVGGTNLAIDTLLDIIKSPSASRREKISACRVYLSTLPQMRILSSIETKLSKLTENV